MWHLDQWWVWSLLYTLYSLGTVFDNKGKLKLIKTSQYWFNMNLLVPTPYDLLRKEWVSSIIRKSERKPVHGLYLGTVGEGTHPTTQSDKVVLLPVGTRGNHRFKAIKEAFSCLYTMLSCPLRRTRDHTYTMERSHYYLENLPLDHITQ